MPCGAVQYKMIQRQKLVQYITVQPVHITVQCKDRQGIGNMECITLELQYWEAKIGNIVLHCSTAECNAEQSSQCTVQKVGNG